MNERLKCVLLSSVTLLGNCNTMFALGSQMEYSLANKIDHICV